MRARESHGHARRARARGSRPPHDSRGPREPVADPLVPPLPPHPRRDSLRAGQIMQDRLLKHDKIRIEWNRTVSEVLGDDGGVSALRLASTTGEDDLEISVQGMFVAIGHDPSTAAFKDALTLDEEGYIIAETGGTRTSVEGVFAAGDCVDKIYRQAVTAAGMGCMAALDAERWLGEQD